ncbi:Holliday junction resolvase RuvX [Patescibacteria group bacterium]|nr:Holliday junction resolvase RuvX [Patescibacteria group bacterium]
MRILGIDYGTKRIGLALSDESGSFAFPLKVISQPSTSDVDGWSGEIREICEKNDVRKIVLGRPGGYKGDPSKILEKIEKFKMVIERETGRPVVYENEVLTTQQARRPAKANQPRGRISNYRGSTSIVKNIDASAAALILQCYLDRSSNMLE